LGPSLAETVVNSLTHLEPNWYSQWLFTVSAQKHCKYRFISQWAAVCAVNDDALSGQCAKLRAMWRVPPRTYDRFASCSDALDGDNKPFLLPLHSPLRNVQPCVKQFRAMPTPNTSNGNPIQHHYFVSLPACEVATGSCTPRPCSRIAGPTSQRTRSLARSRPTTTRNSFDNVLEQLSETRYVR
jgi:hypothetical protein